MQLYDDRSINTDILLDLPMREGTGAITGDIAKPHHVVDLVNTPTWTAIANKAMTMVFDGSTEYAYATNANTADLEFTSGDYSLGCWIKCGGTGSTGIIMGRYELNVGGWELYYTDTNPSPIVTLRHHHSLVEVGGVHRSACYSTGWTINTWWFVGVTRTGGGEAQLYKNGVAATMVTGGLADPEASTQDLVIGVRYTKNAAYYNGSMYRPRIWNRAVTAAEWLRIYNEEAGLFA